MGAGAPFRGETKKEKETMVEVIVEVFIKTVGWWPMGFEGSFVERRILLEVFTQ